MLSRRELLVVRIGDKGDRAVLNETLELERPSTDGIDLEVRAFGADCRGRRDEWKFLRHLRREARIR